MSNLNGRLTQVEKRLKGPDRIIILWPGDELPEDLKNEPDVIIIRVIYAQDWREDG